MGLRTLCVHVPWPELAAVLDIRTTDAALPTVVVCPMCGGKLSVYEDNKKNGAWHHCADCGSAGDLVQLAASAWGIDIEDATLRLAERVVSLPPEAILPEKKADRATRLASLDQRLREFWKDSRDNLLRVRSVTISRLREQFRLNCSAPSHRWTANGGLVLGMADRHTVERAITGEKSASYPQYPSSSRVFTGGGWDDVLVAAYHDLPERPSGFVFVGRGGTAGDRVYRRAHATVRSDFGLAGMSAALASSLRTVVAVDDPMLMARLHCRQTSLSAAVLPIVAWHDGDAGRTRQSAYACLDDRRIVFWSWKPDYRQWLQAMSCDGWVCAAGPRETGQKTVDHYLRSATPLDLYRRVNKMAVPWREGLATLVESESVDCVEALFSRLRAAKVDIEELAEMLPRKAREIALKAIGVRAAVRTVTVDDRKIVEANGGWQIRKGSQQERLTDFTMRLRSVSLHGKTLRYNGDLVKNGRTAEFSLSGTQMACHAKPMLQAVAHRSGLGTIFIKERWAARLLRVAEAFSPPLEAPEAP